MHYAWIITFTGILVFVFSQGFGKMAYPVILPFDEGGPLPNLYPDRADRNG